MSVSLNPVTLRKLQQFGRRRRRLVIVRGVCAAVASLPVMMVLVAVADWRWVLSDATRWTLSLTSYAGAVLVVWMTSLRLMLRAPTDRELARRIESAAPDLREHLLAAIELASRRPDRVLDSPVFRRLLQEDVARRMEGISISSLLPLRLLRFWLAAAILVAAVCGTLLWMPGPPFRQLMTRALLPGANIDRISRIRVAILNPVPHSLTVPRNETVAVVVEISGGEVDGVTLETRTAGNGVQRREMRPRNDNQYATNLNVGSDVVEYRVLAGDAVTRKYVVRSVPRPTVLAFQKTFHYPEYAELEPRTVTEPHGDLIALDGTRAELTLELDQPASAAEIRVQHLGAETIETITLEAGADGRWRAALPITEPAIYKVRLVAAATGFENTFSPKYEIRPEPDLIPRVGFLNQQETNLLLPPNEILSMAALAEDDLPLVSLSQHVSVNGRPWQSRPLRIASQRRVQPSWEWDLLELSLTAGDQVTTKLVATDRKGNEGESIPLRIVVASPAFDPDRHAAMEAKIRMYDKIVSYADLVEQQADNAASLVEELVKQEKGSRLAPADRAAALDAASKVREESDKLLRHIVDVLPGVPAGIDAYEFELAASLVARVRHEAMNVPRVYLDAADRASDEEQATQDLQRVAKAFRDSAENARGLQRRCQDLVTRDVLAAVARDLDALWRHQQQLLKPGTELSWQRLLRQETVAVNQILVAERLVRDNLPRLAQDTQRRLEPLLEWTGRSRERLEEAMESEELLEMLRERARALARELADRQNIDVLDGDAPRKVLEARRELDQRAGSIFAPLDQLARSASDVTRILDQAGQSDDSVTSGPLLRSAERAASELSGLHYPSTGRLASRQDVTQSRPDANRQFAADLGMTRRAVAGLFHRYVNMRDEASDVPEILAKIAAAYRVLESGHETIHTLTLLDSLLALERWNAREVTARVDHPRRWDAFHASLEAVHLKARDAQYPPAIVSAVSNLRWTAAANAASRKITSRRYKHDPQATAVHELVAVRSELAAILEQVAPLMDQARAIIAQYVPTIPEMARNAASDLRQFEQQTIAAADHAAGMPPDESRERLPALQERQQQVNQQLDDLVDALVEDANSQDLLTDQGRERARDADDGIAMLQEPADEMNRQMREAAAAGSPQEQARELSQAAEQQERAADTLSTIAEHFERLESGQDVTQSRNALRQSEREMGLAGQLDRQYQPVATLGEMAGKSSEQLLAELEAELQNNPAMRESLSEISRDALEQAKSSLEYSADQEDSARRDIERSDSGREAKKQPLVQELRDIAAAAARLGRTRVNPAGSAAARGEAKAAEQTLADAQRRLEEAARRPHQLRGDAVLEEIVAEARAMADLLGTAVDDLARSRDDTAKAKDETTFATQEERDARRREMETSQRHVRDQLVRDAKDLVRERKQLERQASQQAKATQNNARNIGRQLQQVQQNLQRSPENESIKRQVDQLADQLQAIESHAKEEEKSVQQATLAVEEAERMTREIENAELPPLNAANPAAELANRLADQSHRVAEELAKRAQELAKEPDWADQLRPDPGRLAEAGRQQQEIGDDVQHVAEDVARAARHERRLGQTAIPEELRQASDNIAQVAAHEVADAESKMNDAARAADPARGQPRDSQSVLDAQASVQTAEQAIRRQANALGDVLQAAEESAAAGEQAEASPDGEGAQPAAAGARANAASPEETARGQLLARTLDDLDRAVAAARQSPAAAGQPQPAPTSLAQAAQGQAAAMARTRAQHQAARDPAIASALDSRAGAALEGTSPPDFQPITVNRDEQEAWGKL
ncbi:MAG: hypothetical protein FJ276_13810, partial [Planctomycetes bacterium]|nr:hypothetical protein [Planctomycetota bacterium]